MDRATSVFDMARGAIMQWFKLTRTDGPYCHPDLSNSKYPTSIFFYIWNTLTTTLHYSSPASKQISKRLGNQPLHLFESSSTHTIHCQSTATLSILRNLSHGRQGRTTAPLPRPVGPRRPLLLLHPHCVPAARVLHGDDTAGGGRRRRAAVGGGAAAGSRVHVHGEGEDELRVPGAVDGRGEPGVRGRVPRRGVRGAADAAQDRVPALRHGYVPGVGPLRLRRLLPLPPPPHRRRRVDARVGQGVRAHVVHALHLLLRRRAPCRRLVRDQPLRTPARAIRCRGGPIIHVTADVADWLHVERSGARLLLPWRCRDRDGSCSIPSVVATNHHIVLY
jgi:hypothetical protein